MMKKHCIRWGTILLSMFLLVGYIIPMWSLTIPVRAYDATADKQQVQDNIEKVKEALENGNTETFITESGNVFEYVCCPLHPEIDEIKNHLKKCGAFFAMMSGSGPSVFGIFEKREDAQNAFETYKGSFQGGGVCELI